VDNKHQHHQAGAGPDHAQRHVARQLMLNNQGHRAGDHQQKGQPAKAMAAVVVMMAVMVAAMVMASVPATMVFPGMAALIWTAFVQREFIAYADI